MRSTAVNRSMIEDIAEKVHNIMDILRDCPDEILTCRCEQILDRLDTLAATEECE